MKKLEKEILDDLWCLYMDACSCSPDAGRKLAEDKLAEWKKRGLRL